LDIPCLDDSLSISAGGGCTECDKYRRLGEVKLDIFDESLDRREEKKETKKDCLFDG